MIKLEEQIQKKHEQIKKEKEKLKKLEADLSNLEQKKRDMEVKELLKAIDEKKLNITEATNIINNAKGSSTYSAENLFNGNPINIENLDTKNNTEE